MLHQFLSLNIIAFPLLEAPTRNTFILFYQSMKELYVFLHFQYNSNNLLANKNKTNNEGTLSALDIDVD